MTASLESLYRARRDSLLVPIAKTLCDLVIDHLQGAAHIDRVTARAKAVDRFLEKAAKTEEGRPKYTAPLVQIQDQIGVRVVVYYLSDVETISRALQPYFRHIETKEVAPKTDAEFGYFGRHFIAAVPQEAVPKTVALEDSPTFFELQIKTLFQHAWSEAEHDLAYKCKRPLTSDEKRFFAYTAAQAWGADQIFGDLCKQLSSAETSGA